MKQALVIFRWVLGVFFALSFFVYFSTSIVTAVGSLILAVMLIPPLAAYVFTKIPYNFSRKVLIIFGGIVFIVAMSATSKTEVKGIQSAITPMPTVTPTHVITISPTNSLTPTVSPTATPTPTIAPTEYIAPTIDSGLSNDNYYINSSGNDVHSPAYSNDNSVPAGATAKCTDGTYSFSQHRSGTCSHHGGVAEWL